MFTILIITVCMAMTPHGMMECTAFAPKESRTYPTEKTCNKAGLAHGHILAYSLGPMHGTPYTVIARCAVLGEGA